MLGTAIRSLLLGSGADIVQLVRREPAGPRELRWDPSAQSPIVATDRLEGLSAAIHLSGANLAAHRWTPAYRREMWTSRVGSTRALCNVLTRLRQPPGAILVASATGIYGDRGDELVDESSPPGSGFLADLCREWEQASESAALAGIRVVHLRFGVVLGRGGALAKMLPAFRLGLGGRLGSGRQWMSWITLEDAVAAVRLLLTSDIAGAVNICAPKPVTNAELTRVLGLQLHRPTFLPVPTFALRAAFGQMANEALLAGARVFPKRLTEARFEFVHPQIEQALAAILG
jgi:uncharacterized protein